MIVVMPNGRAQKNDRAEGNVFASAPAFAAFEKDLLEDVIPAIESRYSVAGRPRAPRPGRACRWAAASRSTSAWRTSTRSPGSAASPRPPTRSRPPSSSPIPRRPKKQLKLLWLSCGNKDGLIRISQGVHAYLKEKDVPHVWHVDGHAPRRRPSGGTTCTTSPSGSFAERTPTSESSRRLTSVKDR